MNALRRHPRALCWTMVVVLLSSLWLAGLAPQRASTAIVDQVLGALVVCGAHDGAEPDGSKAPSPPALPCLCAAQGLGVGGAGAGGLSHRLRSAPHRQVRAPFYRATADAL